MMVRSVSLASIRKVNQNIIDGKKTDASSLPTSMQQDILNRRYSADEINSAYAKTITLFEN